MWVDKPAVLFHIRFAPNFYHFMCQGVAGILYVLQDCGLLPRHLARWPSLIFDSAYEHGVLRSKAW